MQGVLQLLRCLNNNENPPLGSISGLKVGVFRPSLKMWIFGIENRRTKVRGFIPAPIFNKIYFLLFFIFIFNFIFPLAYADGIGISPNKIDFGLLEKGRYSAETTIYNPNDFDIKFNIEKYDKNTGFLPESGIIPANGQQKIKVIANAVKDGDYSSVAVIKISSQNSIIPAVGLQTDYSVEDDDETDVSEITEPAETRYAEEKQSDQTAYVLAALIIASLIGILLFILFVMWKCEE